VSRVSRETIHRRVNTVIEKVSGRLLIGRGSLPRYVLEKRRARAITVTEK